MRPSGKPQERLITQARYRNLLMQPELYEVGEARLDALLMWQSHGFELTAAHVVIPNGWDKNNRLVVLDMAEVPLPDDLGRVATFDGADEDTSLIKGDMPILAPAADVEEIGEEPYEEEEDWGGLFATPNEELSEPVEGDEDREEP